MHLALTVFAAIWAFHSAPLAVEPATGRESLPGVYEIRVPSKGSCGWWEASHGIVPLGSCRLRATAEITLDDENDSAYNDVMMFVRWNFPDDGKDRSKSGNGIDKGKFYQRDFVAYTDKTESGKTVRTFDETFAVPGECDSVEVEFIAKWHPMTVAIRDFSVGVADLEAKPRKVRCVVGLSLIHI